MTSDLRAVKSLSYCRVNKYLLGTDDSPLIADDRDVNLFEDLLVSAPLEAVLAPAGDVAPLAGELLGPVRKADW